MIFGVLYCAAQATMVCMDNSEWMRNGDYSPTRFQAQADAVNLICGAKTQVMSQDKCMVMQRLIVILGRRKHALNLKLM